MERSESAVPSTVPEQRRRTPYPSFLDAERPPRRRRSALLGGAVLIAASPVAVGAGLFVTGFAALGLGALLLLLPPRARRERSHRTPMRVVRRSAAAGGHGAVVLARGTARVGASVFRATERFAAGSGRDGAVWTGRTAFRGANALGRAAFAAGSRGWSAVQVGAPRVWHGLVAVARWLARETRSASIRVWVYIRPLVRRAWGACEAGAARAAQQLAAVVHSASERLSAYVDSRSGPR